MQPSADARAAQDERLADVARLVEKHGVVDVAKDPRADRWAREVMFAGKARGIELKWQPRHRLFHDEGFIVHVDHVGEPSVPRPVVTPFPLLPLPKWRIIHTCVIEARDFESAQEHAEKFERAIAECGLGSMSGRLAATHLMTAIGEELDGE